LVRYVPGTEIALEAKPRDAYWGTAARVGRITFRIMPDEQARLGALRAGTIHLATDITPVGIVSQEVV
jgi:ABC-type transport system substrate-binding protein